MLESGEINNSSIGTNMKKVYIVNNGGHDYSDAERYGELNFCTSAALGKWDISAMFRELTVALEDAHPDDYLMISSLTSLCAVATAILADRFGEVHFLVYKDGKYLERDLILNNEERIA